MNIQGQFNKILNYFRRPEDSAKCAKERLQIIIAHERDERCKPKPEFIQALQRDLLDVVSKYFNNIQKDDVKVEFARQNGCSILELNIMLPSPRTADC